MAGEDNPTFVRDELDVEATVGDVKDETFARVDEKKDQSSGGDGERDSWGNGIEFLLSCVALSVGLGNIWRFPFVALENGGGAFVIPYIIVLVVIGKPVYFLEMVLGQFSSSNSVKSYNCVPVLRGVGMGQVIATVFVATYYSSIMAITLRYLFDSFRIVLPWSECRPEWGACIASGSDNRLNDTWSSDTKSSAELYFVNEVIQAKDNIMNGIGWPIWNLIGFLILSWAIVFIILLKGVKSAGKAAYVLAIFPYVVLIILLIRALTLPGAFNGIKYFFMPQWDKILEPKVWYAAVTQVFFSLNIFFGSIMMYASYNKFNHNVNRDATIVTTLDTFTSLLSGCCIFGIIGHLAHELGIEDISLVLKGGPGLAFISYPDAISKFTWLPQVFAVLFFLMLFLLGIGSLVAMTSCATALVKDRFTSVKNWQASLGFAIFGIISSSVYLTPGGQSVLQIVDHYGATLVAFILAIAELYAFCYIYGVDRLCKDIEFMLGFRPNWLWRLCWRYLTPGLMTIIVLFTLWSYEAPKDGTHDYPAVAHAVGWVLTAIGLIQVPLFAAYKIYYAKGLTLWEKVKFSFMPTSTWGPRNTDLRRKYHEFLNYSS